MVLIKPKNNYTKLFKASRELRKIQTYKELEIWEEIRNRKLNNLKFTRQKIFGEFIVDFYCSKLNLAIEVDGGVHNIQKDRDREREDYLKDNFKLRILRIKNEEIPKNNLYEFLENKIREFL
jgi:very-short-patch-repair endonuclease